MSFLTLLLIIVVGWYLANLFVRYLMPRLVMWMLKRKFERATGIKMPGSGSSSSQRRSRQQARQQTRQRRPRRRGKIIPKDVGEYVEFEEIATYSTTTEQTATKGKVKYKEEEQISDAEWVDL